MGNVHTDSPAEREFVYPRQHEARQWVMYTLAHLPRESLSIQDSMKPGNG